MALYVYSVPRVTGLHRAIPAGDEQIMSIFSKPHIVYGCWTEFPAMIFGSTFYYIFRHMPGFDEPCSCSFSKPGRQTSLHAPFPNFCLHLIWVAAILCCLLFFPEKGTEILFSQSLTDFLKVKRTNGSRKRNDWTEINSFLCSKRYAWEDRRKLSE